MQLPDWHWGGFNEFHWNNNEQDSGDLCPDLYSYVLWNSGCAVHDSCGDDLMIYDSIEVPESLIQKAEINATIRTRIVKLLRKEFPLVRDFTEASGKKESHMMSLIAEAIVINRFKEGGLTEVETWNEYCTPAVPEIVNRFVACEEPELSREEMSCLKDFIYDDWDFRFLNKMFDVKTARTDHLPKPHWEFPVKQYQVDNCPFHYIIATFITKDWKTFYIGGVMDSAAAKEYRVSKEGFSCNFDNPVYLTSLRDYTPLNTFLNKVRPRPMEGQHTMGEYS